VLVGVILVPDEGYPSADPEGVALKRQSGIGKDVRSGPPREVGDRQ
jgi:hypothetical protein